MEAAAAAAARNWSAAVEMAAAGATLEKECRSGRDDECIDPGGDAAQHAAHCALVNFPVTEKLTAQHPWSNLSELDAKLARESAEPQMGTMLELLRGYIKTHGVPTRFLDIIGELGSRVHPGERWQLPLAGLQRDQPPQCGRTGSEARATSRSDPLRRADLLAHRQRDGVARDVLKSKRPCSHAPTGRANPKAHHTAVTCPPCSFLRTLKPDPALRLPDASGSQPISVTIDFLSSTPKHPLSIATFAEQVKAVI